MASPISPTTGQPVNFHTNVNRAKTKRWIEAKPIAYDGNDWGEGNEYEEPPPTGQSQHGQPPGHPQNTNPTHMFPGQRYGDLTHRQPGQPANRSATNPAPMHVRGRPSFDQGDERRAFSSTIEGYDGGFEGPYPTAQRAPFSPTDQYPQAGNNDSRMGPQRGQSPFSGRQQVRRPSMEQDSYSRAPFMPDSRSGPYPDPRNGRYAGQIPQQGRRSQSSGRPSHADLYGGRDSPSRVIPPPLSAVSNGSRDGSPGKSFPPRKSSLSQQTGPPEFTQPQPHQEQGRTDEEVAESPAEAKPLPFIRPADIYKRMAEEREKERRASEESSRPSLEDLDSQKRLKPALDPVAERKSEYGLENLIKGSEPSPRLSSTDDDNGEPAKDNDQSGHIPEESATTHKLPDRDEPPSITSETEKVRGKPSTSDGRDASAINVAESAEQVPRSDTALRHHPSAGFTSVVHQGFDDSQNKVPPTPSSVSGNSLIRSNSASASDISPVIERASSDANERPMSSSTITPTASQSFPPEESDPLPPPPPIQPGFRRESRTPSPGNSPARRPMSVATADLPREELAILSTNTPTQDKPYVPSQIPRAESPLKGTVRDLAGKIENRSPASSPVRASTPAAESPRPSSQRLESFRPSLPGGWISYTTMGTPSPIQGSTPFQSTDNLQHEPAAESASQEDDMPVAGPPKPIEQGYDVSGTAFQALAGAASALSDAFGTVTGTNQDWSENGTPTEESTTDATPASERPGGLSPVQEVPSVASNAPPTPPAKDTPYDRKTSPLGYFPSPLRTSNSAETPTPMRPQMLPALSTDNSPQDTESDRLRKEIVRSLTPKAPKVQSELQTEYKPQATPEPIEAEHSPTAHPSSSESVQQSMDKPGVKDSGHVDDIIEEVEEDAQGVDDIQAGGKARQEATEDTYDLDAVVLEKESDAGVEEEEVKEPSVKPVEVPPTRPLLQKKFSWEASTEDVEALREPTETAPGTFEPDPDTVRSPETSKAPTSCATTNLPLLSKLSNDEVTGEVKDRPTIIPVPASNENLRSDLPPPPVAKIPTEPRRSTEIEPDHEQLSTRQSLSGGPAQISTSAPASEHAQEYAAQLSVPTPIGKDISFREILSMSTAQERIKAYNSSRQQVAAQDSGLANWIQVTGSQHAEHQQLLNRNGRPLGQQADGVYSHKPSPSRSKFSGFGASPGGAGQQPNAHSNEGSKTSFGSPLAGKITTQQVQEEGKKLLQSAGKLGGKAGGAAKGLFAKGKNKFRASSGGGDKALSPSRHTPQPVINVEDVQHSSGTATTAPQISPIFTGANSNDTWSLSYAPSENVSRTPTTVNKTPDEQSTTEKPKYAKLGPPSYTDEPVESRDTLRLPSAPSPVSALGSTHQDAPSRSISEVTAPDARNQNPSPVRPDQDRDSGGEHIEEHVESSQAAPNSPQESRGPSSHVPDATTPVIDRNESLTLLKRTLDEPPDTDSPGSMYSRPTDDMQLRHRSTDIDTLTEHNTPIEDGGLRNQSQSNGLKPRRSMVSAVSSPSPGPAVPEQDNLARTITRHSVSPAEQDIQGEKQSPAISPPVQSPPYEDATPPYSAAVDSKEAEAAAERSLEASPTRPQSLPAYQSPTQEHPPNLPFQPSAIVPVADLSEQRREEGRRPSSRPFSFTNSTNEDILHRHTPSKESQVSSLSKELGLDMNEPNLGQHPALRGMADKALPSQNRNYIPGRPTKQNPTPNVSMQQEQQFRIPGPYGQQFRSPKPVSTSLDVGKTQLQRPPNSAPLIGREPMGSDPVMTHHRHRSSEADVMPRVPTTEYAVPGVAPPQEPSKSTTKPRSAAARLFRPRSRSRSGISNEEDFDHPQSHQQEDGKKQGRSGIFWSHNRHDNDSISGRPDSARANSGGSYGGLNVQQGSPGFQNPDAVHNEKKTRFKPQKFTKKLHDMATSSNQTDTDNKKKGGFPRLSGLFAKSGKQSPPPLVQKHAVQRSGTVQPIPGPPPPAVSARAVSVPHPVQQYPWRIQEPPQEYNDQRTRSFRGQAPPVGGYYAPSTDSVEHQPRPIRDPDAFIGGHRLSDQRLVEQARALKNVSNQAENQYQISLPQPSPKVLPHSAPPSSQHFDPIQTQQPRTSQRFPPELNLRIDTTGHLNPNRRSQPVPLQDSSSSRGRAPAPEQQPTTNNPSNLQRPTPYTVPNRHTSPHSPYGYGSARGLRKEQLSHAIDLHKRSRSPRNGRRESLDSPEEIINAKDPANKLGTFAASKKPAGESGEDDGQEKPWKLDLPRDDNEPRTAGEKVVGVGGQRVPLGSSAAATNAKVAVELPGSKVKEEEGSDDEPIVMSSTAYPGQEWMPDGYGYGHWDD